MIKISQGLGQDCPTTASPPSFKLQCGYTNIFVYRMRMVMYTKLMKETGRWQHSASFKTQQFQSTFFVKLFFFNRKFGRHEISSFFEMEIQTAWKILFLIHFSIPKWRTSSFKLTVCSTVNKGWQHIWEKPKHIFKRGTIIYNVEVLMGSNVKRNASSSKGAEYCLESYV